MRKIFTVMLFLLGLNAAVRAQHVATSATWEVLNTFSLKSVNNKYILFFPPAVTALENKAVQLPGYIVPIKVGKEHKEFMLSVLPVEQCAFCGSGNYPPMILVKMQKPIPYTDRVVNIKGRLQLNKLGDNAPEYSLIDANSN
jgi:hypothetical protein